MTIRGLLAVICGLLLAQPAAAQVGDIDRVHDPAVIQHDGMYYVYSTGHGRGIYARRSADLVHWTLVDHVFGGPLPWHREQIEGVRNLWAPDVARFNGQYHLYYSVSTFGSNRSLIALATNATLDPDDPEYEWVDQGVVFQSHRRSNFNAIDPNVVFDQDGRLWMSFGSFWSGVKMLELDPETGKPIEESPELVSLAFRPGSTAVEAPYIVYREPYYYLFVSFDHCCRGTRSTYRIMVGRSKAVSGPYEDREGQPMMEGGGTEIVATDGRFIGPGHNSVLVEDDRTWLVHHFYDAEDRGRSKLQIRPLSWTDDGWPQAGAPVAVP